MGNSSSSSKYKPDVIVLHQFVRSKFVPCPSPFALKLETWIRMAGLKYENSLGIKFSSKGKVPWIELNGEQVADSQFCIEYLSKRFDINMNAHLSQTDLAISRAVFKMIEESLFWCMALHRFVYSRSSEISGMPKLMLLIGTRMFKKYGHAQGYGRHTKDELYQIGRADLDAINVLIGNKKFLFGDEPCDTDASLFGLIAQFINTERGPLHHHIMNECPNIKRHYEGLKEKYWPDWNDNLKPS